MNYLDVMTSEEEDWVEVTLDKIRKKMAWVSEKSKMKIPYTTVEGVHTDKMKESPLNADGVNWWTNGFWPGLMWQMFYDTKDERYAEVANITEDYLDQCFDQYYGLHHDVGFMWLPSAVVNYKLTGKAVSRKRALHAASLLAGRFNLDGRFIRAWNDFDDPDKDTRGWAIIDCMFNIPLLYWASEETLDPRFRQIAMAHADTVIENFVRPDGSCEHIVEFDFNTGEKLKIYGGQGYADGSSWTRGQGWAMYGFMMSYIHTKEERYLDTAKKIANYIMANIPDSGLIPIDFRQPSQPDLEDSTASAIFACGLIEIAKVVPEMEKAIYMKAAIKLLKALEGKRTDWTTDYDGLLTHCSGSYHGIPSRHISMIYSDYYFVEAMYKLKGNDLYIW